MADKVYRIPDANRWYTIALAPVEAVIGAVFWQSKPDDWFHILIGVGMLLLCPVLIWNAAMGWPPIRITSDAIKMGKKRYPYAQILRVRMVTPPPLKAYPQIQVEGEFDSPGPFILRINYDIYERELPAHRSFKSWDWYGTQEILGDLLARLPSDVEVDSNVRAYAETGRLPKISTLPHDGWLG